MADPVEGAVVAPEAAPLALSSPPDVMALMGEAIKHPGAADALERLVALKERLDAKEAERQFAEALSEFQATCPTVTHNRKAEILSKRTGSKFSYTYADLPGIKDQIRDHLIANGFSVTWDTELKNGVLRCACVLRHRGGHSATAHFDCGVDTGGRMSDAQATKAALTFARRCSLIQVLGITDAEEDLDGAEIGPAHSVEGLTPEQVAEMEEEIATRGADVGRFLAFAGEYVGRKLTSLADIPRSHFTPAMNALRRKGGGA